MSAPIETTETEALDAAFEAIDQTLAGAGALAAIEQACATLEERGDYRGWLDALLLKARVELGLPAVQVGSLNDLPEPGRSKYEERYVEALRTVGKKLLDRGEIAAAWPYFRAIGEKDLVAAAIEAYAPGQEGDEQLGGVVDVAFNQGVAPKKGFELILRHYGTCSSITAFEHLPPDEAVRAHCAEKLVRQLHEHLVSNLRADFERQEKPLPPEGTSIEGLVEGNDWLFSDDAYHIDISHLGSTVRVGTLLSDPEAIALAADLTEYGRRLSDRHKYEGDPPFENLYEDHRVFLRALLGKDVDQAISHFRGKLPPVDPDGSPDDTAPAQVLVKLLSRVGREEEAIGVAADYLATIPEGLLTCPGLSQLCRKAGRLDRLAEVAKSRGDLVAYLSARLPG